MADLKSPEWTRRADEFEKIKLSKQALQRSEVKTALVDLLDTENQVIHTPFTNAEGEVVGASGQSGEDYTEYYYDLADTVAKIADWRDQHQVCVLAEGSYDPDSPFGTRLAIEGGAAAATCLLKRAQGNLTDRRESIPVLVHLAAATNDLPPATQRQIREATTTGLRDSDVLLRQVTVQALGKFGKPDMIPILQDIARSDPVSRLKNGQPFFTVREAAAKAIQSIQERAKTQ